MTCLTTLMLIVMTMMHIRVIKGHNPSTSPGDDLLDENQEIDRSALVYDPNHIKEHLDGEVDFDPETATKEEMEFYFFKIHDSDGDRHLDGLELLAALRHRTEETITKIFASRNYDHAWLHETLQFLLRHHSANVDKLLRENDKDDDGLLNYAEYAVGRAAGGPWPSLTNSYHQ